MLDRRDDRLHIELAEWQIAFKCDTRRQVPQDTLCKQMRTARPDIVIADQRPALGLISFLYQLNRGAKLLVRRFSDGEQAGCVFASFVKGRIDVWNALPDNLAQPLAHGADMHSDNGINELAFDQLVDHVLNRLTGFKGRVNHDKLDATPPYSVAIIQLCHGDLCA
eukprot:TRINITY_DN27108_c0_g1_i1.p2 TRINITY_DN27108_c0_g1~~TRINITY_DN27108_c0_g1_i1.p2  ORF type:complete len:166 (+),score=0.19 TRINITY_DN27108_c0_g1_i1:214-711(+)